MDIYVDTAIIEEIKEVKSWGILRGVTTNPTLIHKAKEQFEADPKNKAEKFDIKDHITKILKTAGKDVPVSLEVIGSNAESMISQGKKLHKMFNSVCGNVVIKIPVCPAFKHSDKSIYDGLKTISALTNSGIKVNATLIMTPEQAYLAAQAGADFVSPFLGRMENYLKKEAREEHETRKLENGKHIIEDTVSMIKDTKAKVIAASIRDYRLARASKLAGADIATIPFNVLKEMISHEMTTRGMKTFTEDADKVPEYKELFE